MRATRTGLPAAWRAARREERFMGGQVTLMLQRRR
jgi:hypothetical protein